MMALIVAVDNNNLIGNAGAMPWHLPVDLTYFKRLTMGKAVVMGRQTLESIGHALPGRQNWVLSRRSLTLPNVRVVTLPFVLRQAPNTDIFIIGGATVYAQFWHLADHLYLTQIDGAFDGDVWLHEPMDKWQLRNAEPQPKDENNAYNCVFKHYVRTEKIRS